MIQSHWIHKGLPVKTIWRQIDSYEGLSPITQVYGVCFTNDKKIMVIRNPLDNGEFTPWNLPGGTPETGETPEQTLYREVDEEADISIDHLELLGASEVFFPNNPNREKGDHFYQLRYFTLIKDIRDQTPDPHDGKMVDRRLIPAEEFTSYIEWGEVGEEIIRLALERFKNI